jgi:hypothetical protein
MDCLRPQQLGELMSLEHSPNRHRIEAFVSEREAAKFLNVSPRTMQRWRVEPPVNGAPKFYRLGARVVYRLSELSAWAEENAFHHTSEYRAV